MDQLLDSHVCLVNFGNEDLFEFFLENSSNLTNQTTKYSKQKIQIKKDVLQI